MIAPIIVVLVAFMCKIVLYRALNILPAAAELFVESCVSVRFCVA